MSTIADTDNHTPAPASPSPIPFTVGTKVCGMGDSGHGDPVVLDAARAHVSEDGTTTFIPVINIVCPFDGGEMMWDDGVHINAHTDMPLAEQVACAGASCANGCGYTFNTTNGEK